MDRVPDRCHCELPSDCLCTSVALNSPTLAQSWRSHPLWVTSDSFVQLAYDVVRKDAGHRGAHCGQGRSEARQRLGDRRESPCEFTPAARCCMQLRGYMRMSTLGVRGACVRATLRYSGHQLTGSAGFCSWNLVQPVKYESYQMLAAPCNSVILQGSAERSCKRFCGAQRSSM